MVQQILATKVARKIGDMRYCNECVPVSCCQELQSLLACKTGSYNAPATAKLSLFDRIERLQQTQDHFSRERCISERNIRMKTGAKYVCCDV